MSHGALNAVVETFPKNVILKYYNNFQFLSFSDWKNRSIVVFLPSLFSIFFREDTVQSNLQQTL